MEVFLISLVDLIEDIIDTYLECEYQNKNQDLIQKIKGLFKRNKSDE